jgi:hypothetical protein
MMFGRTWRNRVALRFSDREDLGSKGVYEQFWRELPQNDVVELLNLIEFEYGVRPGLLRPDDPLTKLTEPVRTTDPVRWLIYQVATSDKHSELNYKLSNRMKQNETQNRWQSIDTVDDFVRAWCGCDPTHAPA